MTAWPAVSEPRTLPKSAKMEQRVLTPTAADLKVLQEQEAVALRLLRDRYGNVTLSHTEADLRLLQKLVDDKVVPRDHTYELQCLGIALGQVFANQGHLQWVTVEDEFGRDPALRYQGTTSLIFPLTMISTRIEDGRAVDLPALYRTIMDQLRKLKKDPNYRP